MVKSMLKSALLVAIVTVALCGSVAADAWVAPSWLDDITTNSYAWTTWGGVTGPGSYVVAPDATTGTGTGSATVVVDPAAAGLLAGDAYKIGTRSNYVELGPTGSIHLDVTAPVPDGTRQWGLWVTSIYHEDMTAAPTVSVSGAHLARANTVSVENTSLDPLLPSQWTLYEALWVLDSGDIATFNGLDVVADPSAGSNIQQVTVHTGFVPEPSGVLALLTGIVGFAGIVLRRKA